MNLTQHKQQQDLIDQANALNRFPPRKPKLDELIESAIATANWLDKLLLDIAKLDQHNANIEEAQEFAEGILLNVKGFKKEINATPCNCGKCASCIGSLK